MSKKKGVFGGARSSITKIRFGELIQSLREKFGFDNEVESYGEPSVFEALEPRVLLSATPFLTNDFQNEEQGDAFSAVDNMQAVYMPASTGGAAFQAMTESQGTTAGLEEVITAVISCNKDPNNVMVGDLLTFTASVTIEDESQDIRSYQWFSNGSEIPGELAPSFTYFANQEGVLSICVEGYLEDGSLFRGEIEVPVNAQPVVTDRVAPVVTIGLSGANPRNIEVGVPVTVAYSATDESGEDVTIKVTHTNSAMEEVTVAGVTGTGQKTATTSFDAPGTYILMVTATDAAGNSSSRGIVVTVKDTTKPTVELDADIPDEVSTGDKVVITLADIKLSDNHEIAGSALLCSGQESHDDPHEALATAIQMCSELEGQALIEALATFEFTTYTFDTPGTYTLTLIAWDASGNFSSAEQTITVTEQTAIEPPDIKITQSAINDEVLVGTQLKFTIESPEAGEGDSFTVTINDVPVKDAPYDSELDGYTFTYTFTQEKLYRVEATFTDSQGNIASDTIRINVVSDTTPPVVTITDSPSGLIFLDSELSFTVEATDNSGVTSGECVSIYDAQVGGNLLATRYADGNGVVTFESLSAVEISSPGIYYFRAEALDGTFNMGHSDFIPIDIYQLIEVPVTTQGPAVKGEVTTFKVDVSDQIASGTEVTIEVEELGDKVKTFTGTVDEDGTVGFTHTFDEAGDIPLTVTIISDTDFKVGVSNDYPVYVYAGSFGVEVTISFDDEYISTDDTLILDLSATGYTVSDITWTVDVANGFAFQDPETEESEQFYAYFTNPGNHTITVTGVSADGTMVGTASITLNVYENDTTYDLSIDYSHDGEFITVGQDVDFTIGKAHSPQDRPGLLGQEAIRNIRWEVKVNGVIQNGVVVDKDGKFTLDNLVAGSNIVTVTYFDDDNFLARTGVSETIHVYEDVLKVTIGTDAVDPIFPTTAVRHTETVKDAQGNDYTKDVRWVFEARHSEYGTTITWDDNTSFFNNYIYPGSWTIVATAYDDENNLAGTASITLTVVRELELEVEQSTDDRIYYDGVNSTVVDFYVNVPDESYPMGTITWSYSFDGEIWTDQPLVAGHEISISFSTVGKNTVYIRAVDAEGNTGTKSVDVNVCAEPKLTLAGPTTLVFTETEIAFEVTVTDDSNVLGDIFLVIVDPNGDEVDRLEIENNTSSYTFPMTGIYTAYLTSEDSDSREWVSEEIAITVVEELEVNVTWDDTDPIYPSATPVGFSLSTEGAVEPVSWTVTVDGQTVVVDENGAFSYPFTTAGEYDIIVTAEDSAGSIGIWEDSIYIANDKLALALTKETADPIYVGDTASFSIDDFPVEGTNVTWKVYIDDVLSEIKVDDKDMAFAIPYVSADSHTVQVIATDNLGNIATSNIITFQVARTDIAVDVTYSVENEDGFVYVGDDITFTFDQPANTTAPVQWFIRVGGDETWERITLENGEYVHSFDDIGPQSVAFRVVDAIGSYGESELFEFTVAREDMGITVVLSDGQGPFFYPDDTIKFDVDLEEDFEPTSWKIVINDNTEETLENVVGGQFSYGFLGYAPGTYTVMVYAIDGDGNYGWSAEDFTVTLARDDMPVSIVSAVGTDENGFIYPSNDVTITVNAPGMIEDITWEFSLNGGNSWSPAPVEDGSFIENFPWWGTYSMLLRATDADGNKGETEVGFEITVSNDRLPVVIEDVYGEEGSDFFYPGDDVTFEVGFSSIPTPTVSVVSEDPGIGATIPTSWEYYGTQEYKISDYTWYIEVRDSESVRLTWEEITLTADGKYTLTDSGTSTYPFTESGTYQVRFMAINEVSGDTGWSSAKSVYISRDDLSVVIDDENGYQGEDPRGHIYVGHQVTFNIVDHDAGDNADWFIEVDGTLEAIDDIDNFKYVFTTPGKSYAVRLVFVNKNGDRGSSEEMPIYVSTNMDNARITGHAGEYGYINPGDKVTFTVNEPDGLGEGARWWIVVDDGVEEDVTVTGNTLTYDGFDVPGSYSIRVVAIDSNGNRAFSTVDYYVDVYRELDVAFEKAPEDTLILGDNAEFTVKVEGGDITAMNYEIVIEKDGDRVDYEDLNVQVDDGIIGFVYQFEEGEYTVTVTVFDDEDKAAGTDAVTFSVVKNLTATLERSGTGNIYAGADTGFQVNIEGGYGEKTCQVFVDGEPVEVNIDPEGNFTYRFTTTGVYEVAVRVTDGAGSWVDTNYLTCTVLEDNEAPVITLALERPDSVIYAGSRVAFTGTWTDNSDSVASVTIYLDNIEVGQAEIDPDDTFRYQHDFPRSGTYIFKAVATDGRGNVSNTAYLLVRVLTATPDTTPPEVGLSVVGFEGYEHNGIYHAFTNQSAVFNMTATDDRGVIAEQYILCNGETEYRVDANGNVTIDFSELAPGQYTFQAYAEDPAENGTLSEGITFIVSEPGEDNGDEERPTIESLDASPQSAYPGEEVAFTVNASDNTGITSWELYIDNQKVEEVVFHEGEGDVWTFSHTFSEHGSFDVRVVARDAAGNVDMRSITYEVLRDTEAPVVTYNPPSAVHAGSETVLSWEVDDNLTPAIDMTMVVTLNGVALNAVYDEASERWVVRHVFPKAGIFILSATATDAAGNSTTVINVVNVSKAPVA